MQQWHCAVFTRLFLQLHAVQDTTLLALTHSQAKNHIMCGANMNWKSTHSDFLTATQPPLLSPHVHGLWLSALRDLISSHMQVHLAQESMALTAEWPNTVSGARPSVQGPQGPTPYPAYLLQYMWAAMAAICEAVGKQMLFFHLWNRVFGKQSAFWWPESSHWVQRGEGRVALRWMLTLQHPTITVWMCWHGIIWCGDTCASHSSTYSTKTQTRLQSWCGLVCSWAVPLSVSCWCWWTIRGWGCVSETEKPEWDDRLSQALSRAASISPCPRTSHPLQPGKSWQAWHMSVIHSQTGWRGQQHTKLHMLWTHFITHPHTAGILVWLHDDTAEVTPVKQEKTRRLITVKMRQPSSWFESNTTHRSQIHCIWRWWMVIS